MAPVYHTQSGLGICCPAEHPFGLPVKGDFTLAYVRILPSAYVLCHTGS